MTTVVEPVKGRTTIYVVMKVETTGPDEIILIRTGKYQIILKGLTVDGEITEQAGTFEVIKRK